MLRLTIRYAPRSRASAKTTMPSSMRPILPSCRPRLSASRQRYWSNAVRTGHGGSPRASAQWNRPV